MPENSIEISEISPCDGGIGLGRKWLSSRLSRVFESSFIFIQSSSSVEKGKNEM